MVRRNKGLEFFRGRMVESKAEKGNRKRGKGLIDFKERKVGRVKNTQKKIHILSKYNQVGKRFKDKEEIDMCMFCKCDTVKQRTTTHVVNYKNSIIVIKNVPCEECEQCGEKYYTDEVAEQLEKMVNLAKQMMHEIAVLDYSKVA